MRALFLAAPLCLAWGAGALAQPVNLAADRPGVPLPSPPSPDLAEGSRPSDYLRVAEAALAAGRNTEASDALEMAETRMLDRSVPLYQTNAPDQNPILLQINQARRALAMHDRLGAMQMLQAALGSTTAQGS